MNCRPHPLDNLINDDSLFMLEAMVPFIEYPYKKTLVMFIKYRELTAILNALDDKNYVEQCGFNCHAKNTEDMLLQMCRFMPNDVQNSVSQMKQMMQMMSVMNNQSMPYKAQPEQEPSQQTADANSQNSESLFDSVLSILNEGSK